MTLEILTSYGELAKLLEPGTVEPTGCAMPSQLPAWTSLAVRHFHRMDVLRVAIVRQDHLVLGIAPLAARRDALSDFELAGASWLFEPTDLAWSTPDALQELASAVTTSRRTVKLARVPAVSPTVAVLRASSGGRRSVLVRTAAPSPVVRLAGPSSDPVESLSSRRRQDLRRARRRADELGGFAAEFLRPDEQEVDPLVEVALDIEAASWKGRAGSALARDRARGAFYRDLARALAPKGRLLMAFGRVGGRPAAMQMAVESGNAVWLLKIGYDPAHARCSPGQLLMLEALRHAARSGADAVEFLGTQEPWTRMWTEEVRPYVSVHVFPWSWRGSVSFARKVGRAGARRMRRLVAPGSSDEG